MANKPEKEHVADAPQWTRVDSLVDTLKAKIAHGESLEAQLHNARLGTKSPQIRTIDARIAHLKKELETAKLERQIVIRGYADTLSREESIVSEVKQIKEGWTPLCGWVLGWARSQVAEGLRRWGSEGSRGRRRAALVAGPSDEESIKGGAARRRQRRRQRRIRQIRQAVVVPSMRWFARAMRDEGGKWQRVVLRMRILACERQLAVLKGDEGVREYEGRERAVRTPE